MSTEVNTTKADAAAIELGDAILVHLAFGGIASEATSKLIHSLCTRIQRQDSAAPMELYRLLQGFNLSEKFPTERLDAAHEALSKLMPRWACQ